MIVCVSKNIRPYIEAADGMMDVLAETSGMEVETFNLEKIGLKAAEDMALEWRADTRISLVAAVGPEAVSFIWGALPAEFPPKLYSIVLNPEKLIGPGNSGCGISLNIPASVQLELIHRAFEAVKRVGIFFDPANNQAFYQDAGSAAFHMGITVVPLQASSMKDIPMLLEKALGTVECIWLIPDKTVISESIARHIIKQAVIKRIPVVGYNQFFYESGAALAFVFDYSALGRQAGELAKDIITQGKPCTREVPVFEAWVNGSVMEKLGIQIPGGITSPMRMGP